ncbi:succinate dehydrogenase iron-sulfur protein [Salmonella enterica subsp. enterica]|uniref:Succinate dehydrogenase iron-sulfur protein n=1 Tax=Salmonella enterica I TaxID=59201 RepID=A0A3S4JH88_SALET|nr:succinate dehydrogenase iron-sulfur protein [Salmonella enterica subsp. enterica]
MQDYTLEGEEGRDMMLLDALIQLKEKDPSLSFRRFLPRRCVRF